MKRKILLIVMILSAAFLFSCSNIDFDDNNDSYSCEFFAMDTVITITAYGENAKAGAQNAKNEILRLEALLSTTDESSEIFKLNQNSSATVSAETAMLIKASAEYSEKTDGAFDISVYPIVKLYGFTTGEYHVPNDDELKALLDFVDYTKITANGNSISLDAGVSIDLGAIAKGYAGDCAAKILSESGVESAVVSLGGNVQLLGKKPDGETFKIAVRDPAAENGYIGYINAADCSIVTSGSYQRYFEENGIKYHHIIDPKTGKCADSGIISATAICKSGQYADALSTAFYVMGAERVLAFCADNTDVSAILVDKNNTVTIIGDIDFHEETSSGYNYIWE